MRKNLVVSNETKSVMNQVIGTLKTTGLSGVEISTLVGDDSAVSVPSVAV